jgi:hypothetical protein
MPGTVYFHIGGGKTGTSAIQVALVRNRALLLKHGLVYPEAGSDSKALKGLTTSGNGVALRGILWSAHANRKMLLSAQPGNDRQARLKNRIWAANARAAQTARARLRQLIDVNAGRSFVYSSEGFEAFSPETIAALSEVFKQNNLEVKIIYYVRHLMDHALSSYNQFVKGQMFTSEFVDFLKKYPSRFRHVLENYSSVVGKSAIILRLYDKEQSNLAGGFFELLLKHEGIKTGEPLVLEGSRDMVNRSLTLEELEIMLLVNRHLAKASRPDARQISRAISDQITRVLKATNCCKVVSEEELRILRDSNRQVLEFVNDFADGEFKLQFKSGDILIGTQPPPEEGGHSKVYRAVIESLIEQLGAPRRANPRPDKSTPNLRAEPAEADMH